MSVRNRLVVIIAVVFACLWAIVPPREKIKLGLDLNGGVHLVLRVKTEKALQLNPQLTADELVEQARQTIERRVNELGVSEAVVARYTERDQILVELPGVAEVDRAKEIIKSTAQLRLTLVERGPFADRAAALQSYDNVLPTSLEVLPGPAVSADATSAGATASAIAPTFYVVHKTPVVTGSDLRDARPSADEYNRPAVQFTLKQDAAARFGAFTAEHINRGLATVLDDRVTSVANIQSRIDAQGQIVGLSREEMIEQVVTFRSGALPADLEYVNERTIGASLGEASIRSGVLASIAGLVLVMLFMLAYYRLAGVNAVVSIVLNLLILIALIALIPVALTLPGIAGLILTIGMGVDSNVLIFERIKEELANANANANGTTQPRGAHNTRAAVAAGFNRVWITIVDTHVTSLVAAAFLFQFGTTSIRGFATTLTLGLVANVFTAVFASKVFFELMLMLPRLRGARADADARPWRLFRPSPRVTTPRLDVTRWAAPALVLSLALIGAGLYTMATRGLPLGIDFSGGTLVVAEFAEPGVTEEQVRAAVTTLPGDEVVQRYGPASDRRFIIRVPLAEGTAQDGGAALDASVRQVKEALTAAAPPLPASQIVERELVSAAIGKDMQRRGIYATVASIAAIAAYIAIRFRPSFAIGGIAATFHDVFVTLACLSLAGYDLSLNVTAALLTVIGYSVNDTIVVFDRVRENAKAMRGEPLASLVNLSVHQTLSRTVITAGTTLLAVLALYLYGGEALRGFAFTMLVGIVSGTWSTIFIASAIATRLARRTNR